MIDRLECVQGLRALADWIEVHPSARIPFSREIEALIVGAFNRSAESRKIIRVDVFGGLPHATGQGRSGWRFAAEEHIYLAWTAERELLYVGRTVDPDKRFRAHRQKSPWWGNTDHLELVPVHSVGEAAETELALIRHLQPIHNKQGNDSQQD